MVELKLLTKDGRPEHAVIHLNNRYFKYSVIDDEEFNKQFPYTAQTKKQEVQGQILFLNNLWYLYKSVKYETKLTSFNIDHIKLRPHHLLQEDEEQGLLAKATGDLINKLVQIKLINDSLAFYEKKCQKYVTQEFNLLKWLLVKIVVTMEHNGKMAELLAAS